ncbi:MAG: CDP-diacylglycerol--serine O-phosphatidyltransferase [Chrysiogenales bacterium]|nr:MAG: CDP-diacylglycerol--serine O-phosphatidyltransferase [Chrysiogenales bacterium]
MGTKNTEKILIKRAKKEKSRREKARGSGRSEKTRRAIGNFIVEKRSIVPNMITMSNMTMGFFAIILASKGDPRSLAMAGILVCVGTLFDAVDGAVARAMHVASPVGVQLDSLADGIAYGIAPAVIAYQAYLSQLPKSGFFVDTGMLIALIYPICAIYRLARFNIGALEEEQKGFRGLPSPAAGILIAVIPALEIPDFMFLIKFTVTFPLAVIVPVYVIAGLLMVSRIDYGKTFTILFRKARVVLVLTIITMILLISLFSMWFIFVIISVYTIVGIIQYLVNSIRRRGAPAAAA